MSAPQISLKEALEALLRCSPQERNRMPDEVFLQCARAITEHPNVDQLALSVEQIVALKKLSCLHVALAMPLCRLLQMNWVAIDRKDPGLIHALSMNAEYLTEHQGKVVPLVKAYMESISAPNPVRINRELWHAFSELLSEQICENRVDLLHYFLAQGLVYEMEDPRREEPSLILSALSGDNRPALELLLDYGWPMSVTPFIQGNHLFHAAHYDAQRCFMYLLQKGADPMAAYIRANGELAPIRGPEHWPEKYQGLYQAWKIKRRLCHQIGVAVESSENCKGPEL